jgi:sterol-4alpha-carboxylate 3-dehydrogenase (decarboxylating)
MIVPRFISILRQGKAYYQLGDNQNLFDFTYVGNVAHAHLLAAQILLATAKNISTGAYHSETRQTTRVDGECFFITNDTPIYFWDFVRAVWVAAGFNYDISKVWVIPRDLAILLATVIEILYAIVGKKAAFNRQSATLSCATRYYDISKAKLCLGYQPLVPLNEAIDISVKWCLESGKKLKTQGIPKIE